MNRPETILQNKVCKHLKYTYPGIMFISDFAAGMLLPNHLKTARSLQACDYKFPDLTILHYHSKFRGLIIEIKCTNDDLFLKDGKTLKSEHVQEQYESLLRLRQQGYWADFGVGFNDIEWIVKHYMADNIIDYKDIIQRQTKKSKADLAADEFFNQQGVGKVK